MSPSRVVVPALYELRIAAYRRSLLGLGFCRGEGGGGGTGAVDEEDEEACSAGGAGDGGDREEAGGGGGGGEGTLFSSQGVGGLMRNDAGGSLSTKAGITGVVSVP